MLDPSTRIIHATPTTLPRQARSVVTPIYQTSTWVLDDAESFGAAARNPRERAFYTRHGNPNHAEVAGVVADLEGTDAGLVFGSGMGAISSTILALAGHGDHVVVQASMYGGTASLVANLLPRLGIDHTIVDQTQTSAFTAAIRDTTRMILVETPSNPVLGVTDISAVAEIAHAAGALLIADNTFATPINTRPISLGADLVWHSATKYMGGHSDLSAGVLVGPEELVDEVWRTAILTGAVLGPIDAWLLMRGLKTLPLRMRAHNENALTLARTLEAHAAIERVQYPGLESNAGHQVAAQQMDGFGGVLSVELKGGYEAADRFIETLSLPLRSASLGGVESLVSHPAAMWAAILTEEQLQATGVASGLVRMAVGCESVVDLQADCVRSLDAL